jgi:hypothetical protein
MALLFLDKLVDGKKRYVIEREGTRETFSIKEEFRTMTSKIMQLLRKFCWSQAAIDWLI